MNKRQAATRRDFLKTAGLGLAMTTTGISAAQPADEALSPTPRDRRLPREVWVGTLSLAGLSADTPEQMVRRIFARMEQMTNYQPDIVCLPEVFPFMNVSKPPAMAECLQLSAEVVAGSAASFAKQNKCYVVCPVYTQAEGRYYNSAVIIDRTGKILGEYRKTHPTIDEMEQGVMPGPDDPPVFDTDFGKIGAQICFDVNWPDGWRKLGDKGAEIVFWPSAFAGGRMLNAWACMNKYHVVTSTRHDPTRIIDVTGDELAATGRFRTWVCAPVNLEKAFVHVWPYPRQIEALQAKYGRGVRVRILGDEEWAIIESRTPDLKIADALKEFEIPVHREHIARADAAQKRLRR
ncbi:MAG: twin-arginine translocation signal domain-containing protein [Phycisphaerae bacterium]|nr:twin-arginine translocation signal domain-containing protein [Phycisphaerae bacterium]